MFGNISGLVLDADDSSPIAGASVTTSPPTNALVTDDSGKFEYSNITVGNYTITISKNDYVKNTVSVQVKDGETTSPTILLNKSTTDNKPPDEPSNPFPENNAINQPVSLNLSWHASDPDKGDTLTFDVYLYESNNPVQTQIASDITDTTVAVDNLLYNTTYFWQVIVEDSSGLITKGDVWSFQTKSFPLTPVVYATNKDEYFAIYTSDTLAQNIIQLTNNTSRDWWPRVSPRNNKIAFSSEDSYGPQIYLMNRDGTGLTQVTTLPVSGNHNLGTGFCWSFDGGGFYYSYYRKLYYIRTDGSGLSLVTTSPANRNFREIEQSPLGDKLVAITIGENIYDSEIYLMNSDGSNMTLYLANLPGVTESPSFSIDGNKIMYTHDISGYEVQTGRQLDSHIFIVSLNHSDSIDISFNKIAGTNDLHPRFSPYGSHIIFENVPNDGSQPSDIWMMNSDGTNRHKIISNGIMPDWK